MFALQTSVVLAILTATSIISADNMDFTSFTFNATRSASSVTVSPSDGSIYVYGQRSLAPNAQAVFLSKLAPNGTQLWTQTFGNLTFAGDATASHPVIDPATGDVFVAGWTRGNFDGQVINTTAQSSWTLRTSPSNLKYYSVCWSPELKRFVAVAADTVTQNIITSTDGYNWTLVAGPSTASWRSVLWASELGLFVVTGVTCGTQCAMTSPNGFNWTLQNTPSDRQWSGLTWSPELRLLVASSDGGDQYKIMTSPNGINWTAVAVVSNRWFDVTWSSDLGIFASVSWAGSNRVMTSPDGFNWTTFPMSLEANNWCEIVWSPELGIFAVLADNGGANKTIISPNGMNWTHAPSASDSTTWHGIQWAREIGLFIAVGGSGSSFRAMTSPDGITWTGVTAPADTQWIDLVWAAERGMAVAVSFYNQIMTWEPIVDEVGFVSRVTASTGSRQWTRFLPQATMGRSRITSMDQHLSGNSIIIGGSMIPTGTGRNNMQGFVASMSKSTGQVTWTTAIGDPQEGDVVNGLQVAQSTGVIYSVGTTNGTITTSLGRADAFVSQHFATNGSLISIRQLGSNQTDQGLSIAFSEDDSAVYIGGSVGGSVGSAAILQTSGGGSDAFVARLSASNLSTQWFTILGGQGSRENVFDLLSLSKSNVILAACQLGSVSGRIYGGGFSDAALVTLQRTDGSIVGLQTAGGSQSDAAFALSVSFNTLAMAAFVNNTGALLLMTLPALTQTVTPTQTLMSIASNTATERLTSTSTATNTATNISPVPVTASVWQTASISPTNTQWNTVVSFGTQSVSLTQTATDYPRVSVTLSTPQSSTVTDTATKTATFVSAVSLDSPTATAVAPAPTVSLLPLVFSSTATESTTASQTSVVISSVAARTVTNSYSTITVGEVTQTIVATQQLVYQVRATTTQLVVASSTLSRANTVMQTATLTAESSGNTNGDDGSPQSNNSGSNGDPQTPQQSVLVWPLVSAAVGLLVGSLLGFLIMLPRLKRLKVGKASTVAVTDLGTFQTTASAGKSQATQPVSGNSAQQFTFAAAAPQTTVVSPINTSFGVPQYSTSFSPQQQSPLSIQQLTSAQFFSGQF